MKNRLAIYKEGYVNEDGSVIDNKFIKAGYIYSKIIVEMRMLNFVDERYFCQEQEFDSLTGEWITNESEPIH